MRNGKINPITAGNEFQSVDNAGSVDGLSKDGRVTDGPITEAILIKQDQNEIEGNE